MPTKKAWLLVVCVGLAGFVAPRADAGDSGPRSAVIHVISNRADLISGDDALVEVVLPAGADGSGMSVDVDGRDVTNAFVSVADGRQMGRVTGLVSGSNVLTAQLHGGPPAQVTIVNHPNGGPVFSGPQVQPWTCQPTAVDEQCNQPVQFEFYYRSTNPLKIALERYHPQAPASDVASTTTDQGVTVPFIVRVETGYQDRDQYKIATLFQPGQPWEPWAPQPQWNHKLLITHGGGCGISYTTWFANSVLDDGGIPVLGDAGIPLPRGFSPAIALGRGFSVLSTSLSNTGQNCSHIALQAESLMMAKEHFIETHGTVRYTIDTDCSGGSLAEQWITNAYPGMYQGIIAACSYPDVASTAAQFLDYHLLRPYFENPSLWVPGVVWTPLQWAAVEGHPNHLNAVAADEFFIKKNMTPTNKCWGTSGEQQYVPQANPAGVRCSLWDLAINELGPRAPSSWSEMERAAGDGFAGWPVGNAGVQYGLDALEQGLISPAQFVDLNAKIGGLDIDSNPVPERLTGDPGALRNAYRTGMVNATNNLSDVPIITLVGPEPSFAHDAHRSWALRARLQREQGHVANHVMWFGAVPLVGDPSYFSEALLAMDRWLTATEADRGQQPLADKIVANRPADLHDRCSQVSGLTGPDRLSIPIASGLLDPVLAPLLEPLHPVVNPVLDPALTLLVDPVLNVVCGLGPVSDLLQTNFGTPRTAAGLGPTVDVNACTLRLLERSDYGATTFTDAQWAQLTEAFPTGVCDWNTAGIGQGDTLPWLTYQRADGSVIYGGCPLPAAPEGSGTGWMSTAFLTQWTKVAADDCQPSVPTPPAPQPGPSPDSLSDVTSPRAVPEVADRRAPSPSLPATGWSAPGMTPVALAVLALAAWRLRKRSRISS